MKFAIRATYSCGTLPTQYCVSTRHSHCYFSVDATEAALLNQESTAIAAVKKMRLNGYERLNSCVLDVVGINFVVDNVTQVPYPAAKPGFIVYHHVSDATPNTVYFSGVRKQGTLAVWDEAIERATIFKTRDEAEIRLADCRDLAVTYRDNIKVNHSGWTGKVMREEFDRKLERCQAALEVIEQAQIEAVNQQVV